MSIVYIHSKIFPIQAIQVIHVLLVYLVSFACLASDRRLVCRRQQRLVNFLTNITNPPSNMYNLYTGYTYWRRGFVNSRYRKITNFVEERKIAAGPRRARPDLASIQVNRVIPG
jgi:hypothetical protein